MDIFGFLKNRWQSYSIPLFLCGIFYGCLCIFSLVMGIYVMCCDHMNTFELSKSAIYEFCKNLNCDEKTLCLFFGGLTFFVGIIQGVSSMAIWKGNSNVLYGIVLGFTLFSVLSCSSKLFISVNAFVIGKIILYILVLYTLLRKDTRRLLCSHKSADRAPDASS